MIIVCEPLWTSTRTSLKSAKELAARRGTTAGRVLSDLARSALAPRVRAAHKRNGAPAPPRQTWDAHRHSRNRQPAPATNPTDLLTRIALLNVNVLVALFDPAHLHHEAAHDGSCTYLAKRDGRVARSPRTRWFAYYPMRPIRARARPSPTQLRACERSARIVSMLRPDSLSIRESGRFLWVPRAGPSPTHRPLSACAFGSRTGAGWPPSIRRLQLKAVAGAAPANIEFLAA